MSETIFEGALQEDLIAATNNGETESSSNHVRRCVCMCTQSKAIQTTAMVGCREIFSWGEAHNWWCGLVMRAVLELYSTLPKQMVCVCAPIMIWWGQAYPQQDNGAECTHLLQQNNGDQSTFPAALARHGIAYMCKNRWCGSQMCVSSMMISYWRSILHIALQYWKAIQITEGLQPMATCLWSVAWTHGSIAGYLPQIIEKVRAVIYSGWCYTRKSEQAVKHWTRSLEVSFLRKTNCWSTKAEMKRSKWAMEIVRRVVARPAACVDSDGPRYSSPYCTPSVHLKFGYFNLLVRQPFTHT